MNPPLVIISTLRIKGFKELRLWKQPFAALKKRWDIYLREGVRTRETPIFACRYPSSI